MRKPYRSECRRTISGSRDGLPDRSRRSCHDPGHRQHRRPIWKTAVPSSTPSRSPATKARKPPSSMTAPAIRLSSRKLRESEFEGASPITACCTPALQCGGTNSHQGSRHSIHMDRRPTTLELRQPSGSTQRQGLELAPCELHFPKRTK
jgi:hypothetical protein